MAHRDGSRCIQHATGRFGVALGGLIALGALCASAAAAPGMGDTGAAPRCAIDEKVDVMALVYNDASPERSFAMVSSKRGNGRMIGVGSWIAGRPVIAILPRALWLGPHEEPCWMPLSHDGNQRVTKPRKAKKKKRKRRRRR